jgi:hypothetical protein
VTRSEEELVVGKQQTEPGRVRLRTWVETEPVALDVELQRETARVVREDIDEPVSHDERAFGAEEIEVRLRAEERSGRSQRSASGSRRTSTRTPTPFTAMSAGSTSMSRATSTAPQTGGRRGGESRSGEPSRMHRDLAWCATFIIVTPLLTLYGSTSWSWAGGPVAAAAIAALTRAASPRTRGRARSKLANVAPAGRRGNRAAGRNTLASGTGTTLLTPAGGRHGAVLRAAWVEPASQRSAHRSYRHVVERAAVHPQDHRTMLNPERNTPSSRHRRRSGVRRCRPRLQSRPARHRDPSAALHVPGRQPRRLDDSNRSFTSTNVVQVNHGVKTFDLPVTPAV